MDSCFVKRNIVYFVYNYLNRENRKGRIVSSRELTEYFIKEFNFKPNQKTVYRSIADLQGLGIDIVILQGKKGGYYIRKHYFNDEEAQVLFTSLEQNAKNVKASTVKEIEKKLCFILGMEKPLTAKK